MPTPFADDPYKLLEIPRDATPSEIKKAHKRLAKRHHPDISGDPAAGRIMARINAAYDLLASPSERALWDRANPVTVPHPGPPTPPPQPGPSTARPRGQAAEPPPAGPPPGASSARPQGSAGGRPSGAGPAGGSARPSVRVSPSLDEAFAYVIGFGKFRGRTLASIALVEPGYLRWILRTITDKPELVRHVRVVVEHLDSQRSNGAGNPASTPPPRRATDPAPRGTAGWPGAPPSGTRSPTPPWTSAAPGRGTGAPPSAAPPAGAGAAPAPVPGQTSTGSRPAASTPPAGASLASAKALLGPAQIVACFLVCTLLGSFFIRYGVEPFLGGATASDLVGITVFMGLPAALFGATGLGGLYLYWLGWRADRRRAQR